MEKSKVIKKVELKEEELNEIIGGTKAKTFQYGYGLISQIFGKRRKFY